MDWNMRRGQIKHLLYEHCLNERIDKQLLMEQFNDLNNVEPIKHGKWLIGVGENGEPIGTYCSECGWSWERNIAAIQLNKVLSRIKTPRCPYCGAKMDEVKE